MPLTRREFLALSLTSSAGLYLTGCTTARLPTGTAKPPDEDGSQLWLRYAPHPHVATYRRLLRSVHVDGNSATCTAIRREWERATRSLFGRSLLSQQTSTEGALWIGTPQNSALIRNLNLNRDLELVGAEGYVIRSFAQPGQPSIVIAANSDLGALYGSFHLLRLLQTAQPIDSLNIQEQPALQLRLLNHWDNPNGTIERGYAGRSLWQWEELPGQLSPRYLDYARACASIGINGAVINNVNADPRILTTNNLRKVAALANVWRPYGIKTYLSANFAAPVRLGELSSADPLDARVIDWWKTKATEIYELIPDFGGFLVKANSEGQPGPKTYQRSHAEGANMLADALAPHQGNVLWRAFVYDEEVDPDRLKRAYLEFTRLDGQFRPNVAIQVKNGALDFQPREPFHPLFGALKETSIIAEIQPSQEYLGQAKHLVYLGPQWEEFLRSDTHVTGAGATVAKVLAGKVRPGRITGMASVVNPGLDANWCGHHFSQANWYACGRFAWNPDLSAAAIAAEWTRMTFTNEPSGAATIQQLMLSSHENFVNYTMPLGLHHLIGGDHYAPAPWNDRAPRPDWTATYYHQASAAGIGFDRTRRGNRAVEQYALPVCEVFDDIARCPEKFLLWFHRCSWEHRMQSGRTLWEELCAKYNAGAAATLDLQQTWQALQGKIDDRRHREVADRLAIQAADAAKWRDQILEYFGGFSQRPIIRR